jgi:hypothetical protein
MLFSNIGAKLNLLTDSNSGGGGASNGSAGSGGASNAGSNTSSNASGNAANTGASNGVDWSKWAEALPEDLRNDPGLSTIKTIPDLAKSYVSAQKLIGKDKIAIPDAKHATEADWLGIYQKLGAPSKVEDFNFKLPDGIKETDVEADFLKSMKEVGVSSGLAPWQMEKVFNAFHGFASSKVQQGEQEFERTRAADIDGLKKEWGQAYENQIKKANTAFMELLKPEERKRLIDDGIAGHPSVVKILANAAKMLTPDKFIGHGDGINGGMTPADAEKRARDIMADPNHAYRKADHPNHKAAKEEVAGLWKIAYPEPTR